MYLAKIYPNCPIFVNYLISICVDMIPPMTSAALPSPQITAGWFHALSDETRLGIVEMLSHGERCVCDLQRAVGGAQPRLSFHLRALKDAGLVTDRRAGRWVYYALNAEALDDIERFVNAVRPGKHAGSCDRACCE